MSLSHFIHFLKCFYVNNFVLFHYLFKCFKLKKKTSTGRSTGGDSKVCGMVRLMKIECQPMYTFLDHIQAGWVCVRVSQSLCAPSGILGG
jgi:hypothetical protein